MKHKNCKNCMIYDELLDGLLAPCDEEEAWELHYCTAYKSGIPKGIWKGKEPCPNRIELEPEE